MAVSINKHSENIFWFDLCPNDESNFISIYLIIDEKIALIETGPASSHSNLVSGIESAGLSLSDVDYVIPTHIHLDHFGSGGHIMEVCKKAKAIVHPKAYKHVSEIDAWWQGSRDFLEHIADLEDLCKDVTDDGLLQASLRDIKLILDRQIVQEKKRKIRFSNV